MKKEEDRTYTEIQCGKRLKITITDGDYTLQEGIDYKVIYSPGTEEMSWLMLMEGIGKYENIYLHALENFVSSDGSHRMSEGEKESFREYFRSEIERNKNDGSH